MIAGRPAEALAARVAPEYPGHFGPVLPAAWLTEQHTSASTHAVAAYPEWP